MYIYINTFQYYILCTGPNEVIEYRSFISFSNVLLSIYVSSSSAGSTDTLTYLRRIGHGRSKFLEWILDVVLGGGCDWRFG